MIIKKKFRRRMNKESPNNVYLEIYNYKPPPHSPNQQHILKPPSIHVHLLLTPPPSSIGKPTCKTRKNNQGKLGSKSQGDGKSDLIQN